MGMYSMPRLGAAVTTNPGIILVDGTGNTTLSGSASNDPLFGGAGNDILIGGAGTDTLVGDAGNDQLYGDDGDDQLFGGAGNDTLDGGTGSNQLLPGGGSNEVHAQLAPTEFDEVYYLVENPDVARAIEAGTIASAEAHFEAHGKYEGRPPNAQFREGRYLTENPDVRKAVEDGLIDSGWDHFRAHGHAEGRGPQGDNVFLAVDSTANTVVGGTNVIVDGGDNVVHDALHLFLTGSGATTAVYGELSEATVTLGAGDGFLMLADEHEGPVHIDVFDQGKGGELTVSHHPHLTVNFWDVPSAGGATLGVNQITEAEMLLAA